MQVGSMQPVVEKATNFAKAERVRVRVTKGIPIV